MKTLMDMEDGQPSVASIAGQPTLSSISPYFEQDVVDILDTVIQDDESLIGGCNITQIARTPPWKFGYLLVTSQRLICVQFESEVTRRAYSSLGLLNPFNYLTKELLGQNVRPKRPWLGVSSVPAVNYPNYALTPDEKASRSVAVHDLKELVSADLISSWYGETQVFSLTLKCHKDKKATLTFYTPHEAKEICRLFAARLDT